jgi:hypothetical protein
MGWKERLDKIIGDLVDGIGELAAQDTEPLEMSAAINDELYARRKIKESESLISTFREVYQKQFLLYAALKQEISSAVQEVEYKFATRAALRLREAELGRNLRVLNVKAKVLLEAVSEQSIPLSNSVQTALERLEVITTQILEIKWVSKIRSSNLYYP